MRQFKGNRETRRAKKLLLWEEYRAECVISVVRVLIIASLTAALIIKAIIDKADVFPQSIPFLIVFSCAILLLLHILIAGHKIRRRFLYNDFMKYPHIAVDVAIIALGTHAALTALLQSEPPPRTMLAAVLYTVLFMASAGFYLFTNAFRFHLYAGLFAGILFFFSYLAVAFNLPAFASLLIDPASLTEIVYYIVPLVIFFLLEVILSIMIAARVRRILVQNISLERFGRFVPAAEIIAGTADIPEKGEKRTATVLMAEIRGLALIARSTSAEETIELFNATLNDMMEVILSHKGSIDTIPGYGIMAVFDAADDAVRASIDMFRKLESTNEIRKFRKKPQLAAGVGIHSGQVIVGLVGSEHRMDLAVLGDTVTIAGRLEKLTKTVNAKILISGSTRRLLSKEFYTKPLGKATIRGKATRLEVFAVNPWIKPPLTKV